MRLVGHDNDLQQEIMSWQVREGVFSGIEDSEIRAQLSEALTGTFSALLMPSERGVSKLEEFLRLSEKAIEDGNSLWSVSEDRAFEDEEEPYTVNTLLAFHHQLQWMLAVFGDEPGISVSIR